MQQCGLRTPVCPRILKEDPGNFFAVFTKFYWALGGFASEMGNLVFFSMKTSDQSSVSQGLSKTLRGLGLTQ